MKKAENIIGFIVLDNGWPVRDTGGENPEYRFVSWENSHYPVALFETRQVAKRVLRIASRRYAGYAENCRTEGNTPDDQKLVDKWLTKSKSIRINAVQRVLVGKNDLRTHRRASLVAALAIVLAVLVAPAHAQTKVDFALATADLTIRTLDLTSTHALLNSPCNCWKEADPLSPGGKGLLPLASFQYGISFGLIESSRKLQARHHKWLGRAILAIDIAGEVYAVQRNMRQHEKMPTEHFVEATSSLAGPR